MTHFFFVFMCLTQKDQSMSTVAVKKRRMRWERRKENPGKGLVTVGTSRKETVAA